VVDHGPVNGAICWGVEGAPGPLLQAKPRRSRCDRVEVVLDAHDDGLRFTPAINDEPVVLFLDTPDDLPELGPGGRG
jgi:hypothetical protein